MRLFLHKVLARAADIVFVGFWSVFYYLIFRYYILKIFWFGTLPMSYNDYDINLLFLWMMACIVGFGFWLRKNFRAFLKGSISDKMGIFIISLIWLLMFFLGIGLVYVISDWLGEWKQLSIFWWEVWR